MAPTIPPGSELAGVPADKLGPVTPDVAPAPGSAGGRTSTVPGTEGETPHATGSTGTPSVGGLVGVAAANALAGLAISWMLDKMFKEDWAATMVTVEHHLPSFVAVARKSHPRAHPFSPTSRST